MAYVGWDLSVTATSNEILLSCLLEQLETRVSGHYSHYFLQQSENITQYTLHSEQKVYILHVI